MHYPRLIKIFAVLLLFLCVASRGIAQTKRGGESKPEPCPDRKSYTGKYINQNYGFSIIIPAGLKGYWNSAVCMPEGDDCVCMQDHGRIIRLEEPALIEAYTGFESFGWSLREYERNDITSLKTMKGIENFKVLSSKWSRLHKLTARRYVMSLFEKNRHLIKEVIIAIHDGIEYRLTLFTPIERYQKNRRSFEAVRRSWRLTS